MKPIVAIVGRPNTGKSTLFNRLVGERRAIVSDVPGTTRDRIYGDAEWMGVEFSVIDTGGLQDDDELGRLTTRQIGERTQAQARVAIEEADVVLFLVDGKGGLTAADLDVAGVVRESGKPAVLGVNKTETESRREAAWEFFELGLGEPVPFSALHGIGTGDLLDEVVRQLPRADETEEEEDLPAIAIVGRPNVGKSALLNSLLGSERSIVADLPGTTRDTIDSIVDWAGNRVLLIDTAGIRRRGRIESGIEKYSVLRSERAVDRADVALVVIDADEGFTAQDQHIAGYVVEQGKGLVLVVNKWDLVTKDHRTMDAFRAKAAEAFNFASWAPLIFVSALSGQRVNQIIEVALHVIGERHKRIGTGELNRLLRDAVAHHPPPSRSGKWVKFYYATQIDISPPRFVFFCNDPKSVHFSYERYLENQLRDQYRFDGTPIVLHFRGRRRDDE
ncbi:MAG TPA: ribosome biogenesis GTPase Der [Thermomicrobiales bacterium]|nr:ribosome biogenesis GTPase Der [Thermomicrobiales bacterium]HRA30997.1 ribosome biogenesis GTPase Der [Thermomicrobiales bacterium]